MADFSEDMVQQSIICVVIHDDVLEKEGIGKMEFKINGGQVSGGKNKEGILKVDDVLDFPEETTSLDRQTLQETGGGSLRKKKLDALCWTTRARVQISG